MFKEVKEFMDATGQTTGVFNDRQGELFMQLLSQNLYDMNDALYELQSGHADDDMELYARSQEELRHQLSLTILALIGLGYSYGLDMPVGMERVLADKQLPKPVERTY